jgi:acetoin utilization protein AcuC
MSADVVFVYSQAFEKNYYPSSVPFDSSRPARLFKLLNSLNLLSPLDVTILEPKPARRLMLKKFHTPLYLHTLKNAHRKTSALDAVNMGLGTADCPIFAGMYASNALAVGATVAAVDAVLKGHAKIAFNPAGGLHHAHPEKASGFCYLNDVAIACQLLSEAGKKVLYLDLDVHFGDGVAYAFYNRHDIMTISLHENPKVLFPGTGFENEIGVGPGLGYCVNIPMPVGTYDLAYLSAFNEIVVPLINSFNPDVFVLQLGTDALAGDPLANLQLTNNTYRQIIHRLIRLNKPIVATGGGGYHLENTIRAWALIWAALCRKDTENLINQPVTIDSTWYDSLLDKPMSITEQQKISVNSALQSTLEFIKTNVFAFHNIVPIT